MRPRSHVPCCGNPFQRHCRLRPQALRNPNLARITLRTPRQLCSDPAQLVQFFLQESPRLFLAGLPARLGMMTLGGAGLTESEPGALR